MAVRPDVRLDDSPMQPVTCTRCSARVEARKSSWEQTTIQWSAAAITACQERRENPGASDGVGFAGCSSLAESIREAAVSGSLPVQSGDPLPVNDEAAHP
ncbi:ferredoxin [Nocardioides sp. JQ2195]|nr:ferredoxin [Nocardioides sp. JQ2195]